MDLKTINNGNMNREILVTFRPEIPGALVETAKVEEAFQNEVLRPIIKFQHGFLEMYFQQSSAFLALKKSANGKEDYLKKVHAFIGNQTNVKHQMIGAVIGMLTEKELVVYWKNPAAYNKRIFQMICQRVADTFY
jgi:hypothetical protein